MNMRIYLLILILFFGCSSKNNKSIQYKTYNNNEHKFSFDMPDYWNVEYNKDEDDFHCVPVTKAEKEIYQDCFEGIVFRIFLYKTSLDETLKNDGYTNDGKTYFTSDKVSDSVIAQNIKGATWKGIYNKNTCGIKCESDGPHGAAGECEFIYFSRADTTVCITTNGKAFNDEILKKLESSFAFH